MHLLYEEFISYLDNKDRQKCVGFILSKLASNELDIVTLYEEILTLSLREEFCQDKQKKICIWEEHVRSSIIRTVIECCYPYVVKERDNKYGAVARGRVVVACPTGELHEIGARMVTDFFTLCGLDATFVGANTPQEEILDAIGYIKPRYMAISVSNYYNLLAARKTIQKMGEISKTLGPDFKVIVGGYAFEQNPCTCDDVGADLLLHNFADIKRLSEGH
jgi:methanogenic corrinoid protein MtbC1